ncbi:MAG: flagellar biosynthetic protein FliR [Gemmatimonadota bacterium]
MGTWTALDLFAPEGRVVVTLLLFRLTGLLWLAPVFSSRAIPGKIRVAAALLLTFMLMPLAAESLPRGTELTAPHILSEILIGMILGLGAAIFVGAAEAAGDMLAVQMGLSGANVLDPMSETQLPVLGQFLGLFTVSLMLATGGHLVILDSLTASFAVLPLGSGLQTSPGVAAVIRLGGSLLWLGLKFAAPVVAAMMVGNVALGILARTVPQLNVLMVAFPVQIAIGLFVLGAALPLMAGFFGGWNGMYRELVGGLLSRFGPGPGPMPGGY